MSLVLYWLINYIMYILRIREVDYLASLISWKSQVRILYHATRGGMQIGEASSL